MSHIFSDRPMTRGQAKQLGKQQAAGSRRVFGDISNNGGGLNAAAGKDKLVGKPAKQARFAVNKPVAAPVQLAPAAAAPSLALAQAAAAQAAADRAAAAQAAAKAAQAAADAAAKAAAEAAAAQAAAEAEQRRLQEEAERAAAQAEADRQAAMEPVDIEVDSPEVGEALARAQGLDIFPVDAADIDDAQMVVELVPEIMEHLFATEERRMAVPDYLSRHQQINKRMRVILLNWIAEVALKFKCCKETLYLAVNVIDRFLQRRAVSRHKLQLVGATALLIASKVEDQWAPLIDDIVYIAANAYDRRDVIDMEIQILAALKFNLTVPYACTFAERFVKVAGGDTRMGFLVDFMCELQLQYYSMLQYRPSTVAAAAVYLARQILREEGDEWDALMEKHSRHTAEDLAPCAAELLKLLRTEEPKYTAVRKKFQSTKYGRVAFLPDDHVQL